MNWINSWKQGNKKEKYKFILRLRTLTLFELKACFFCEVGCSKKKLRFIIFNFGSF